MINYRRFPKIRREAAHLRSGGARKPPGPRAAADFFLPAFADFFKKYKLDKRWR
jgi:hypothetical protein